MGENPFTKEPIRFDAPGVAKSSDGLEVQLFHGRIITKDRPSLVEVFTRIAPELRARVIRY